jgi:hypothetical protein
VFMRNDEYDLSFEYCTYSEISDITFCYFDLICLTVGISCGDSIRDYSGGLAKLQRITSLNLFKRKSLILHFNTSWTSVRVKKNQIQHIEKLLKIAKKYYKPFTILFTFFFKILVSVCFICLLGCLCYAALCFVLSAVLSSSQHFFF